jgi:hypothetical protein
MKSGTSLSALQPEPPQAQPVEADLPLDGKGAAVACGKVLKLNKDAFDKLELRPRLSQLLPDSGFTDEELKDKERCQNFPMPVLRHGKGTPQGVKIQDSEQDQRDAAA